jgi:hypothetical protein
VLSANDAGIGNGIIAASVDESDQVGKWL